MSTLEWVVEDIAVDVVLPRVGEHVASMLGHRHRLWKLHLAAGDGMDGDRAVGRDEKQGQQVVGHCGRGHLRHPGEHLADVEHVSQRRHQATQRLEPL